MEMKSNSKETGKSEEKGLVRRDARSAHSVEILVERLLVVYTCVIGQALEDFRRTL